MNLEVDVEIVVSICCVRLNYVVHERHKVPYRINLVFVDP